MLLNSSGGIDQTYSSDAWGNITMGTGSGSYDTPLIFKNAYIDTTGLIYMQARWYDSTTGQFLSQDPDVNQTLKPFAFADNDAVNASDETGDFPSTDTPAVDQADGILAPDLLSAEENGTRRCQKCEQNIPWQVGAIVEYMLSQDLYLKPKWFQEGPGYPIGSSKVLACQPSPAAGGQVCGAGIGGWTYAGGQYCGDTWGSGACVWWDFWNWTRTNYPSSGRCQVPFNNDIFNPETSGCNVYNYSVQVDFLWYQIQTGYDNTGACNQYGRGPLRNLEGAKSLKGATGCILHAIGDSLSTLGSTTGLKRDAEDACKRYKTKVGDSTFTCGWN